MANKNINQLFDHKILGRVSKIEGTERVSLELGEDLDSGAFVKQVGGIK